MKEKNEEKKKEGRLLGRGLMCESNIKYKKSIRKKWENNKKRNKKQKEKA